MDNAQRAERLIKFRTERDMSRARMAELFGVDTSTVTRWENADIVIRDWTMRMVELLEERG